MRRSLRLCGVFSVILPAALGAQERGANALGEAALGLGVSARVLVVGAHPDDEDTNLIAWLSRGRHVETAYLSLTRGDGGQNVIGDELGEALGALRTEELLAARRIDGARQYFTRAFDFGFAKDTADTFRHWQRDSILGDVVRVIRAFRPHVIVAVFSGTARDGHGQHQVSGILAREGFDVAADTARFDAAGHGAPWTPLKFYRAQRGSAQGATLSLDAGEYSPLLGRSYAEIAGESRSQHKSQGFGALERKGPVINYLRREASRVNRDTSALDERTLFDGIDTTWSRFRRSITEPTALAALDSLPAAFAEVRRSYHALDPHRLIAPLLRVQRLVNALCQGPSNACVRTERRAGGVTRTLLDSDLAWSVDGVNARLARALRLASGIAIEATTAREVFAVGAEAPVLVSVYNRGADTVAISTGDVVDWREPDRAVRAPRLIPPGGVLRDTLRAVMDSVSRPWWIAGGRTDAMFHHPASTQPEEYASLLPSVAYTVDLGGRRPGAVVPLLERVVYRFADDVKGEVNRPTVAAPAISITLPSRVEYVVANATITRTVDVTVRSAAEGTRTVAVSLVLPRGLTADSARRTVRLERGARRTVRFRVRGRLAPGSHRLTARAESDGQRYERGYDLVDYDHIRRQRLYRPATTTLSTITVRVPARLRVAYVPGVSDNVAAALAQLGVNVTVLSPDEIARVDLSRFTTVVLGPRAYEANPSLAAANPRLFDWVRRGGTMVVQYGQYEMTQPGMTPFPVSIARPHDRVTHEEAPVAILQPAAAVMNSPNTITKGDFNGWVQERSLYMPRTFGSQYTPMLRMSDPGEDGRDGALLVARMGRGHYVYTTLSLFRQLPAGVPGAARLLVNMMSLAPAPTPSPRRR